MSVDPSTLPDETGEPWPEDVKGWRTVKFDKFEAKPQGERTWFLLKFSDGNGLYASASLNLFSKSVADADPGKKTANGITKGRLQDLFLAAGLEKADLPAVNASAIAKALNAYEGELTVDAYVGPDGRGFTEATKFAKAGTKVAKSDA